MKAWTIGPLRLQYIINQPSQKLKLLCKDT